MQIYTMPQIHSADLYVFGNRSSDLTWSFSANASVRDLFYVRCAWSIGRSLAGNAEKKAHFSQRFCAVLLFVVEDLRSKKNVTI